MQKAMDYGPWTHFLILQTTDGTAPLQNAMDHRPSTLSIHTSNDIAPLQKAMDHRPWTYFLILQTTDGTPPLQKAIDHLPWTHLSFFKQLM
jgi:hypothetical protein